MNTRELDRSELAVAAELLSRGMCDNPNNVAAFGGTPEHRESVLVAFFQTVLQGQIDRGAILGAFEGPAMQGVCGIARPGQCQPAVSEKLRILGSILFRTSPRAAIRVGRWAAEWSRHDLNTPHWHLGPVAVDRDLRGKGIGTALLSRFCERTDCEQAVGYLETDKEENLKFYQKHGFTIIGQGTVLGQMNWYMSRQPILK